MWTELSSVEMVLLAARQSSKPAGPSELALGTTGLLQS
jgi:hypothetical protein